MRENPALYEVAKQITHEAGFDWHDPRTGKKYPAPKRSPRPRKTAKSRN